MRYGSFASPWTCPERSSTPGLNSQPCKAKSYASAATARARFRSPMVSGSRVFKVTSGAASESARSNSSWFSHDCVSREGRVRSLVRTSRRASRGSALGVCYRHPARRRGGRHLPVRRLVSFRGAECLRRHFLLEPIQGLGTGALVHVHGRSAAGGLRSARMAHDLDHALPRRPPCDTACVRIQFRLRESECAGRAVELPGNLHFLRPELRDDLRHRTPSAATNANGIRFRCRP
jgi:hypothetical protein